MNDKRGADPMSYDNSGHHYSDCTGPGGCDCDERRYGYRGGCIASFPVGD